MLQYTSLCRWYDTVRQNTRTIISIYIYILQLHYTYIPRCQEQGPISTVSTVVCLSVLFVFCISLTADGPQFARLPIRPTATLPSCLLWSCHEESSHLTPILAFRIYIAMHVQQVCVCAVIPFSLGVRLVDAPAGVTQEAGHTGSLHLPSSAVLALTFVARRIQLSLSLVHREVEFCVPTK